MAGALFSIYQGVHTLLGGPEERQNVLVALIVLLVAACIEGVSSSGPSVRSAGAAGIGTW